MIPGNDAACSRAGIPRSHGAAIREVADDTKTIVAIREVGRVCAGLIQEHYAMKGYRIHAKSCDWGPMAGLVCMDPRLNKDPGRHTRGNFKENWEALVAHMPEGAVIRQNWRAGVQPLVITQRRLGELVDQYGLTFRHDGGDLRGTSASGGQSLRWRLISLAYADLVNLGLIAPDQARRGRYSDRGAYFGIFVDEGAEGAFNAPWHRFWQWYFPGAQPLRHPRGGQAYEWLMGMTNPETAHEGFKACTTGDYDLFAVWPRVDLRAQSRLYPAGPSDGRPSVDRRPVQYAGQEFAQMGNITERVQYVAFQINDAVEGAGYRGGFAVWHSDEAFNPHARSLVECFPMIVFLPNERWAGPWQRVAVLETIADLSALVVEAQRNNYYVDLPGPWMGHRGPRGRRRAVDYGRG